MKEKDLDRWVEKYRKAWESNDPKDIAALWTEDAAWYRRPDEAPVLGRDAIVAAWLDVADGPGETDFEYQVLGFGDGVGFVRGWTTYLTDPPSVIPIDVGRQLFVDDFLVESTTLTRTAHRPVMYEGNPVLTPGGLDSVGLAMPYSDGVWYDPDAQLFKMWYDGGIGNNLSYAYSSDGKHWVKPAIDDAVIGGTNRVLEIGGGRDSGTVWYDPQDPDPSRRYKAFMLYNVPDFHLHFSSQGPCAAEPYMTIYCYKLFANNKFVGAVRPGAATRQQIRAGDDNGRCHESFHRQDSCRHRRRRRNRRSDLPAVCRGRRPRCGFRPQCRGRLEDCCFHPGSRRLCPGVRLRHHGQEKRRCRAGSGAVAVWSCRRAGE